MYVHWSTKITQPETQKSLKMGTLKQTHKPKVDQSANKSLSVI